MTPRKGHHGACSWPGCGRHTCSQSAISVLTLPIRFSRSLTTCTAWPGCKFACAGRWALVSKQALCCCRVPPASTRWASRRTGTSWRVGLPAWLGIPIFGGRPWLDLMDSWGANTVRFRWERAGESSGNNWSLGPFVRQVGRRKDYYLGRFRRPRSWRRVSMRTGSLGGRRREQRRGVTSMYRRRCVSRCRNADEDHWDRM